MAFDMAGDGYLNQILLDKGEQNVIFSILGDLPLGKLMSVVFLFIVFDNGFLFNKGPDGRAFVEASTVMMTLQLLNNNVPTRNNLEINILRF